MPSESEFKSQRPEPEQVLGLVRPFSSAQRDVRAGIKALCELRSATTAEFGYTKYGPPCNMPCTFGGWKISLRFLLTGELGWVGFHRLTLSSLPVKWE